MLVPERCPQLRIATGAKTRPSRCRILLRVQLVWDAQAFVAREGFLALLAGVASGGLALARWIVHG